MSAAAAQYRTEHVAEAPRGWRVRMKAPSAASAHLVGIAFPPGRRKKGSGKLVEILHPKDEAANPLCEVSKKAKTNPSELLIFGNPNKRRTPNAGHKKNCPCFACKHQRAIAGNPARENWHKTSLEELQRLGLARKKYVSRLKAGKEVWINKQSDGSYFIVSEKPGLFSRLLGNPAELKRRQERANPRRRRKDRKNPSETEQAVQLFETFHGRDASKIIEKHVSAEIRKDYTALGNLEKLLVRTPLGQDVTFDFDGDGVMLASSPDGKQLYCIGGRQNLLPLLDADSQQKDFIDLGECLQVEYLARKIHSNYEPQTWFHKFGEKTGARPQLMFDKLKKQIFFVGGEYFIDAKVDLSPGIEN